MNPESRAIDLVNRQRRRVRGTLLIWTAAVAVAAQGWAWAARLGWLHSSEHWSLLPAGLAVVLLARWWRRARHLTATAVARDLDRRWGTQARLEAAVELALDGSALAAAQRAEAVQLIAGRRPTGAGIWFTGLSLLALALIFLGIEGTVAAHRAWQARAVARSQPAAEEVRATIVWKAPASPTTAAATEDVPLAAYVETNTGFRTLSLEVEVNGDRTVSRPLEVAAAARPGGYDLATALHLDDFRLKPYDVVTYHLAAVPATARPQPAIVSPLQFIQIRPPVREIEPASDGDGTLLSMIRRMKGVEMLLLQQTFLLAHAGALSAEATWRTELARIGSEQETLAGDAARARQLAARKEVPALVTDKLHETEKAMREAGARIVTGDANRATALQRRVIALLAEMENLFGLAPGGPPVLADPFQDPLNPALPQRESTPAGEIAQLAQRQRQNNRTLDGDRRNPGGTGQGPAGRAEQDAIAGAAAKLVHRDEFDPEVRQELATAAAAAALAARQLKADDRAAAREPAAVALAGLEAAQAAQDLAGRTEAIALLDQVRRTLNLAGREVPATRHAMLGRVHDNLHTAAVREQRAGSADAARLLAALALAIQAPKGGTPDVPASAPDSTERARELTAAVTRGWIALTPRATAFSRTVRQLQRVQPLLADGGDAGIASLPDTELASQEGEWLTLNPAVVDLGRQLTAQMDALLRQPGRSEAGSLARAAENAARLARALEAARDTGQRDEIVRRFKAEDVDPQYRAAVEAYFERLSREGEKH